MEKNMENDGCQYIGHRPMYGLGRGVMTYSQCNPYNE